MKHFIIQIFCCASADSNVGYWTNIAGDHNNVDDAIKIADRISKGNKRGITKVRVLEIISELDCINVSYPKNNVSYPKNNIPENK